jgi:hypothetical protein
MTTLVDYLPRLPEFRMNMIQQVLAIVWFVIFFTWVAVSQFLILANGGSIFNNDPECPTFITLAHKYSPPLWRTVTRWTFRLEAVLLILFIISLFIWHVKPDR